MPLQIAYYHRKTGLDTTEDAARDQQICDLLTRLKAAGRIATFSVEDAEIAFATEQARQGLFDKLREFAMRHKVELAKVFGSRKHGFSYIPSQFLLVSEGDELQEVFPHRVSDRQVEPLEFLASIERGEPWTNRSGKGMEGKKHKALVAQLLAVPDILEPGLSFRGQNVQVSLDFGELGYIDLVFEDREGRTLLVEVKVGVDELDKAFGQILRHRHFFARQNHVEDASIRVGIACPFIPPFRRELCQQHGITCFEIPMSLTAVIPDA